MSFNFLLQELHLKTAEKIKTVKVHRGIITVVIAAVLVTIVFFAVKTNLARSPAAGTTAPTSNITQSTGSAAQPNGGNQTETAMRAKTLKRIENVASILGIAVLTSGGMIIYYKKKKNRVEPLPVLRSEEETH
jgi:LPXTG-motif cell wall-anchored protein